MPRETRGRNAGTQDAEHHSEDQSEHEDVALVNTNQPPNPGPMPGFTAEQATSLQAMITAAVTAAMNAKNGSEQQQMTAPVNPRFVNTPTPTPQPSNQAQSPEQDFSAPPGTPLRAEEVGYFDPEYQQEHGPNGPVVNAGKHVFYKDVYVFTDRLKDLAVQGRDVKAVITSCLRGSALMWYSMELTELERDLLRDAKLDHWYTTLIKRFKTRTTVALSQLVGQTYSLNDIRHASPRAFIQHMLYVAKSAEIHSIHNQLSLIWNQFAVNLRIHLPEPQPNTTIGQFMDQVDSKTAIWLEMAQKQQRQWHSQPASQIPVPNRNGNDQRPRQMQWSRNSTQQQQRLLPAPPSAKAHFVDPQEQEEDLEYDAPSDSYHAVPSFQPPGHTPRRYGNTHDGGGDDAQANWASAGDDHRCNYEGCTHYH